jgi:hypothetical protein
MFDDSSGITFPIGYVALPAMINDAFMALDVLFEWGNTFDKTTAFPTVWVTFQIWSSKATALWDKPENWAFVYILAIGYVLLFLFAIFALVISLKGGLKQCGWLHVALVSEGVLSSAMSFISIFMLGTLPLYRATAPVSRAQVFQNVPAVLSLPPSLIMGYKWTQVSWGRPWPTNVRIAADCGLVVVCLALVIYILYSIENFCSLIDALSPAGTYPAALYKDMNDSVTYANLAIGSYFVASGLWTVAKIMVSAKNTSSDALQKAAKMLIKWLLVSAFGMFGFSLANYYQGLYYDGDVSVPDGDPRQIPTSYFPYATAFTVVYSQLQ